MLRHIFEGIDSINGYSIFSLLIFFFFFVAVVIWLVKADKRHIEEMSRIPLESNESNDNSFTI